MSVDKAMSVDNALERALHLKALTLMKKRNKFLELMLLDTMNQTSP